MRKRPAGGIVVLAGVVAFLAASPSAEAQARRVSLDRWSVELFAGAASPKGDLGDVNDDGQLAGVAVSRWLHPQLALRLEGTFENLERGGRPDRLGGGRGPQTDLWHYVVGIEALFTHPVKTDWRLGMDLGLGGTYVDVDPGFAPPGVDLGPEVSSSFSGHEVTGRAALIAGYEPVQGLTLYARAGGFALFGDAQDPQNSFLGKEVVLTHEAGLRIGF